MKTRNVAMGNKEYRIEHNAGQVFPTITRLERVPTSGVMASVPEEITGRPATMLLQRSIERDEEARVVLALGRTFSRSKEWRREFDWAWERRGPRWAKLEAKLEAEVEAEWKAEAAYEGRFSR